MKRVCKVVAVLVACMCINACSSNYTYISSDDTENVKPTEGGNEVPGDDDNDNDNDNEDLDVGDDKESDVESGEISGERPDETPEKDPVVKPSTDEGDDMQTPEQGIQAPDGTQNPDETQVVPEGSQNPEGTQAPEGIQGGDNIVITYSGNSASVYNPYPDYVQIECDNANVVVNGIVADMVCKVSGCSNDGSLKIYGEQPFVLEFNGLNLTSGNSAAINIQSKKKVEVVLEQGAENSISDGYSRIDNGEDDKGAMFSEGPIIFTGSGKLTVSGLYKHGVATDSYIRVSGGDIIVNSAVQDALHTNTGVIVEGGYLDLKADDDAIQVDCGEITINGGRIVANPRDDGFVVAYEGTDASVKNELAINGGDVTIKTTGEKGMALKSTAGVYINGGNISLNVTGKGAKGISSDSECIIGNGKIDITTSGGVYYVSSNDMASAAGIKCDANLTIDGGDITITSTGNAGKGISVDGVTVINDGNITISTSGSIEQSSNPKAIKSEGEFIINGGSVNISTLRDGGEGIESKKVCTFNGGELYISTYDDAINAKTKVEFNGSRVYAYSSNNDAVDCNTSTSGSIAISDGILVACSNAGAPEGPLDSDHGALSVTGGYLFTMGSEHAVPTSSTATQYTILFSNFAVSKDSYLTVCDADNNVILALKAPCNKFSNGSNSTMVTSPDIENGVTYSIGIAGAAPENYSECWNDLYIGGTVGSFTSKSSMTVSGMYTGSASSGGFPGGPGGGGFPGGGNRPW